VLRRGGKLVICDDFLNLRNGRDLSAREQRWLEQFRRGWHVNSLITVEQARRLADDAGWSSYGISISRSTSSYEGCATA
jgi:hypothetical protein